MLLSEQIIAYREGRYVMEVPPVCTAAWDERSWVRWIASSGWFLDENGQRVPKQTDREEFLSRLEECWPEVPDLLKIGRALMRHTTTAVRLAVTACNREMTATEIEKDRRNDQRIRDLVAQLPGAAVRFGDPRGYVVHVVLPSGRYNTMGGASAGWGVPSTYRG